MTGLSRHFRQCEIILDRIYFKNFIKLLKILVGARGFEPPTTCTPCRKSIFKLLLLLKSIGAPVALIAGQCITMHNRSRKSPANRTHAGVLEKIAFT